MVTNLRSRDTGTVERGDDKHFPHFQRHGREASAKASQIVFVRSTDLLDEAVRAQALEHPRYLRPVLAGEEGLKRSALKSADREFSATDRSNELEVVAVKQVESPMRPAAVAHRSRDLVEPLHAEGRIVDDPDEIQISPIRRAQRLSERS